MSDNSHNDEMWRKILTGEVTQLVRSRNFLKRVPSERRCVSCNAPFTGLGGQLVRLTLRRVPSRVNPRFCNGCFNFLFANLGGAEVEMTLLFADIRGSTTLAQEMGTVEFSRLINRFTLWRPTFSPKAMPGSSDWWATR
jgi:adenylate cyclase